MTHPALPRRILGAALLAAMFSTGPALAQTGSAVDASATRDNAKKSSATDDARSSGSSGASSATSGSAGAGTPMAKADQDMMKDLARANLAEIKTGEMALQKSQNEAVKKFAQKMVDDHTAAMKELQALAQAKGVDLPDEMDMKHKAMSAALEKLSPEKFDETYMKQGGVSDHKKAHKLVQDIQKKAKDTDLKSIAARLEPTIKEHLQMAQQHDKELKAETSRGASGDTSSERSGNR